MAVHVALAVGATTTKYNATMIEMNIFSEAKLSGWQRTCSQFKAFHQAEHSSKASPRKPHKLKTKKVVPILFNFGSEPCEASVMLPINTRIGLLEEPSMIFDSSALRAGGRLPLGNSDDDVLVGSSTADSVEYLSVLR